MATPALGDRDAFGVKMGAEGATVQVFQMRGGRVIDRVDLSSEAPPGGGGEADVVRGGAAAVLRGAAPAAGDPRARSRPPDADWLEEWLSQRADAASA